MLIEWDLLVIYDDFDADLWWQNVIDSDFA